MVDRQHIESVIHEYCRAETEKDKPAWVALFAQNATHEDPVGAQPNHGIDRIADFWEVFQPYDVHLRVTGPIIICGREAMVEMEAEVGPSGGRMMLKPIYDQFTFDDDGKIIGLRAFYEQS